MLLLAVWAVGVVPGVSQSRSYPKPQTASAEGKQAPDFTLKDHDGKEFKLSAQRGRWVLLYFYRGYW